MWVYTGHRNFVDILRTIAHELIHRKQNQQHRIKRKSPPGSKLEREADSEAGMLMKLYARKHPEIIQELGQKFDAALAELDQPQIDPDIAALEEMLDEVKIDNDHGAGAVPLNRNVDYLGLRVAMTPKTFLQLSLPLDNDRHDRESIKYLASIKDNKGFGAPFLDISIPDAWFDGDFSRPAAVKNHDGRHRMTAVLKTEGDIPVETHLIPRGGLRNRDLTPKIIQHLQRGMMAQTGQYLSGPLFDYKLTESLMIIPTAESQNLDEALYGVGDMLFVVTQHAMDRADERGIHTSVSSELLRRMPRIKKEISEIEPGQAFWVYDASLGISLGMRKLDSGRIRWGTTIQGQPRNPGVRNPMLTIPVSESVGVPSLEESDDDLFAGTTQRTQLVLSLIHI